MAVSLPEIIRDARYLYTQSRSPLTTEPFAVVNGSRHSTLLVKLHCGLSATIHWLPQMVLLQVPALVVLLYYVNLTGYLCGG